MNLKVIIVAVLVAAMQSPALAQTKEQQSRKERLEREIARRIRRVDTSVCMAVVRRIVSRSRASDQFSAIVKRT